MGSWSVYCGISNITITCGQKCVLLPLKKAGDDRGRGGYFSYIAAAPPIFGEYDDYGGVEEIEKDDYTDLVESHFQCKIEEFCQFFTRGIIRQDEEDYPIHLMENEEMKDWDFMFIDRKVYDYFSKYVMKSDRGHLDFGRPEILKLLGFEFVGESNKNPTYDPKRFNQHWKFQDKDFWGDNHWLSCGKESVYFFDGEYSSLSSFITIPEELKWLGEVSMVQLWTYLKPEDQKQSILWFFGVSAREAMSDLLQGVIEYNEKLGTPLTEALQELYAKYGKKDKTLLDKIKNNLDKYGQRCSEMTNIAINMRPLSGDFRPHHPYLTPQCGEREEALIM